MSDFSFKRGTFTKLRANSVIHLGRLERNIYEGEVVEYDGLQLKFGGQTTEMPELKAGVKRGWLSIVEETPAAEEEVVKKEVPAPKKEMPVQTVYDEERAVGEVNPQKEEKSTKFPVVVESQDDETPLTHASHIVELVADYHGDVEVSHAIHILTVLLEEGAHLLRAVEMLNSRQSLHHLSSERLEHPRVAGQLLF